MAAGKVALPHQAIRTTRQGLKKVAVVYQHIETIARAVTDLLLGEIRGQPLADHHVLVEPSLIVRASSSGVPGRLTRIRPSYRRPHKPPR